MLAHPAENVLLLASWLMQWDKAGHLCSRTLLRMSCFRPPGYRHQKKQDNVASRAEKTTIKDKKQDILAPPSVHVPNLPPNNIAVRA